MVHGIPSQTFYVPLVIMSLTNWCDRLTLLSYATFNYHSPIHDHSWRPVKTDRDDGSFSIISLTDCQETLSEGQFGKQTPGTYFVWSWRSLVLIPTRIGDLTYFQGHFLRQWNLTTVSSAQVEGVYETPMFISASQITTLEKPLWPWH